MTLRTLALAFALSLLGAPAALADRAETGFEDPGIAPGVEAGAPAVIARWHAMGVDTVRVQAFWNAIAPNAGSPTPPAGFDPTNPNDPRYDWSSVDRSIQLIRANGMRVMLTIHQFGPVWASLQPNVGRQGWMISPTAYAQFATAAARRYRGQILRYLLANEPNEDVFLSPQTQCVGRRCQRVAPVLYANMVRAAYPAVKRADPRAQVLMGELAPIGGIGARAGNLAPLAFIRAMGCLDDRYRRIRTGLCRNFRPARADGFGYHPYQQRERPNQPNRNPNVAKLGDLQRLFGVLDRVTRSGRIVAPRRRFNLYITEYGYETNPPDRRFGVSLQQQSSYLQQSAYIVWRTPRVKLLTQYLWTDDAAQNGVLQGFQTGLNFADGIPKPSLSTFSQPFFIDLARGRRHAVVWGQVRPNGVRTATVFRQLGRRGRFSALFTARLDRFGYFSRRMSLARNSNYFFSYRSAAGQTVSSSVLHVG
jgi:Cellulase (glycosyl hydrolase family 5)